MPNNSYSDVLGAQSKRYRRGNGESRFGNVDQSRLEPLQDVMATATKGIMVGRQKEIERQRTALEQAYINRGLQKLNTLFSGPRAADSFQVNKALDDVTIEMLRHGGTKARQTASDIQKLRRRDNTDTSLTPEEEYLRGKIPFTEYEKIKKAGRATPQEKVGFKWRQREKNGTAVTEKVGGETYFIEEETDLQGKPTGSSRRKGASKSRSSLVGWASGGKASIDIPVSVDATSGKAVYRQVEGTKDDVVKQIKASAKSLDATVRKFSQSKGSSGFLGFGAKESWEKFLSDDGAQIDDLPKEIQPYAVAYNELLSKLAEVEGASASPQGNSGEGYSWEFEE